MSKRKQNTLDSNEDHLDYTYESYSRAKLAIGSAVNFLVDDSHIITASSN